MMMHRCVYHEMNDDDIQMKTVDYDGVSQDGETEGAAALMCCSFGNVMMTYLMFAIYYYLMKTVIDNIIITRQSILYL